MPMRAGRNVGTEPRRAATVGTRMPSKLPPVRRVHRAMTRSLLPALVLPFFLAASARADIPPPYPAPTSVALSLAGVFASAAPDAPAEDVTRIQSDVQAQ